MPLAPRFRDCGNRLLDKLPAEEFDRLEPELQQVSFELKQVVQKFDSEIAYVHFPLTTLASLLTVLEDDEPVEVAVVGREGVFGVSIALGINVSQHKVICQMDGEALRIPARQFLDAVELGPRLRRIIHRYVGYMLRTASQTVACNALHTVESRACRWLLIVHDQAQRDKFPMTQEFMAYMLGVRRQTVTVVMGSLQTAGLVGIRRGLVAVRDRTGLEEAACECYQTIRDYYEHVVL